jgi:hypothetical protein
VKPFLLLFAVAACGGQIVGADASAGDAGVDVVTVKDAAKPPHCDLAASDYDTSCSAPSDCSAVFLGNACTSSCACENGTIASSSVAQYEADYKAVADGGGIVCPCPPPEPPSCCKGACVLGPCPP